MRIFTLEDQDEILIDGNIVVKLTEIDRRGKCRLGITAPRQVSVMRAELLPERKESNDRS